MRRVIMTAFAATALATSVIPANAQFSFPGGGIDGTEARLQARINAGIQSGALSRGEVSRLEGKLQQINQLEMRLRTNGNGLSWRERRRLQSKLNDLSNDITREMNDRDRNYNGGFRHGGFWNRY
ncbi:MAG TPA: hypothetical protein V6C89_17210 [Drouetiella sp.]